MIMPCVGWGSLLRVLLFFSLGVTFAAAQSKSEQKASTAIPPELLQQLQKAVGDSCQDSGAPSFAENFRVKRIDINGDDKPEFVVHTAYSCLCGATGNCSFWIYQRTSRGYKLLLDTGMVQTYEFKRHVSHGYRDLVTAAHDSAFRSELSVYKFNGSTYQRIKCMERVYPEDDLSDKSKPRITVIPCKN